MDEGQKLENPLASGVLDPALLGPNLLGGAEIESWRCATCQFALRDAYEKRYSEACIRCFEKRLATCSQSIRPISSPIDLRQDMMLLMLAAVIWLSAATDACF